MIKELDIKEFDEFAKKHPLKSYHQTSNYANLMAKHGYVINYIGYYQNSLLVAASLILIKKISFFTNYGYAPKGFLIDYFNESLVKEFILELINYYHNQNVSFIRINPEISIGEIDYSKNFITNYNSNAQIIKSLESLGLIRVLSNSFQSILPRFNAIIKTSDYSINKIKSTTKANINKAERKGLELVTGTYDDINVMYEFIKHKKNRPLEYYQDYYKAFKNQVDIFLVRVNYDKYLLNIRDLYEKELAHNQQLADILSKANNEKNLSLKMQSDSLIVLYKDEIIEATKGAHDNNNVIIASAMTIRYDNRVNIVISGYNKIYKNYVPNYFLHHEIIKYYQNTFKFVELNGITGIKDDNKYKGLNEFKLSFKPKAYEFIGEFDVILDPFSYKVLNFLGILKKEFKK